MQDELSMQLGQLYFRIADGSVQQKTLRDRVKQAAEMPVQMQLVKHLNQNAAMQKEQVNALLYLNFQIVFHIWLQSMLFEGRYYLLGNIY